MAKRRDKFLWQADDLILIRVISKVHGECGLFNGRVSDVPALVEALEKNQWPELTSWKVAASEARP